MNISSSNQRGDGAEGGESDGVRYFPQDWTWDLGHNNNINIYFRSRECLYNKMFSAPFPVINHSLEFAG